MTWVMGCCCWIVSIQAKPFSTNINTNTNYNFNIDDVTAFIQIFNTLFSNSHQQQLAGNNDQTSPAGTATIPAGGLLTPPSLDELTNQVRQSSSGNNVNINNNINENILSVFLSAFGQILDGDQQQQQKKPIGIVPSSPAVGPQSPLHDIIPSSSDGSLNINTNNNVNSILDVASIFDQVLNSNFASNLDNHRRLSAARNRAPSDEPFQMAGLPHHPQDKDGLKAAQEEFFKTYAEIKARVAASMPQWSGVH